jgi:ABC-type branched-subunit amino acid transport system ATPase component/branched-subunit amino acid ABC-type transport system permease component
LPLPLADISTLLPFVVIGVTTGAVYGLAGVGLVLTYKTSGIFNFAHGSLAAVSAYLFYVLYVQHGVAWPVAAAICVLVLGPAMGLLFERFAKALTGKSLAVAVTSTVGVLLIVESVILLIFGTGQVRKVPVFLPGGGFQLDGTFVPWASAITFGLALAATAALWLMFRYSRIGAAMRAVVEAPELLELGGTNATGVRRTAWVIGVSFACASGVLFAPLLTLDPVQLTLLVVAAFGAAALGAFTDMPLTFLGGLLIGVGASVLTKYANSGVLVGLPPSLPFLVLFVVLLCFPRRYLAERSRVIPSLRSSWTTPAPVQLGGGALVLIGLALVPAFAGIYLTDWTVAMANVILFLSLGLLVRTTGQVSLCHVTFMAIGATAFSHLVNDTGLPWVLALLAASLIAVPVGMLLAIPAIRLTPLYLALATFGFGVFVQYMFYTQSFMFGTAGAVPLKLPRPDFLGLGGETGFYYLVLGLAVVACLLVVALTHGRLGRLLRGMAESPTAVQVSGVTVNVTWVLVFCLSAAMAAFAGALAGIAQETVSISSYPPLLSLTYLALILIVVGGAPWYALIAGLAWTLPPIYIANTDTSYWLTLIFGVFAVLYAFTPDSMRGAPPLVRETLDRWFRRAPAAPAARPAGAEAPVPAVPAARAAAGTLAIEGIAVRYGGVVAVEGLSLAAPTGRITGLIGPNGAGKTTTFNAASGFLAPSHGSVVLDDGEITRRSPAARARLGIGRTFQQLQLFDSLSVRENVAIGAEGRLAGANPTRHLMAGAGDAARVREAVDEALELCGIAELAGRHAGALSTGQRRLVELARALAGDSRIILMDEPSSGLDRAETARFGELLMRTVEGRGIGILLVEHDMSLVMEVCRHIYVLDFGRLLFEGSPEEVIASPVVQAAYLGEDAAEDAPAAR